MSLENRNDLIQKAESVTPLISRASRNVATKITTFDLGDDAIEIVRGTVWKAREEAVFGVQEIMRQPFKTILIDE
jgi:hypothetical protein